MGTIEKAEFDTFTVDTKNNTLELSEKNAAAKEVTYKHSDEVITIDISYQLSAMNYSNSARLKK